jgi:hypothetical protein
MIRTIILATALLCAVASIAEARQRQRTVVADPGCNVIFPCEGVAPSPRGERIVKAMGGFGAAQKVYTPRDSAVVSHPSGCPSRAFCGCGAAVRVFGSPIRSLWLAANWFKFPRAAPAPGTVAVRRHHVFVLEADLGGGVWSVYDANSGRGLTRIHARSLAGYVVVNPHGGA